MSNSTDNAPWIALEARQEAVLKQIEQLEQQVAKLGVPVVGVSLPSPQAPGIRAPSAGQSLTLVASPSQPPYASLAALALITSTPVHIVQYWHSSVSQRPKHEPAAEFAKCGIRVFVIWKDVNVTTLSTVAGVNAKIEGDATIAKYLLNVYCSTAVPTDDFVAAQIDEFADAAVAIRNKPKDIPSLLNAALGRNTYLTGASITVADVLVWGALSAAVAPKSISGHVKRWYDQLSTQFAGTTSLAIKA